MADQPEVKSLFLQESKKRKPVEVSGIAVKAKAKAPPNLAIYDKNGEPHEVLKIVMDLARKAYSAYSMQRADGISEKWEKADSYYWMEQKDNRMPEFTRAKVSSSAFYRVTRRLANGANIATFPSGVEKLPVKLIARTSPYEPSDVKDLKARKAEALNIYGLHNMQRADIDSKRSEAYHRVYKYANAIYYTPYEYEVETRRKYEDYDPNGLLASQDGQAMYVHRETGETSCSPFPAESRVVEYDYPCKDHVGFHNVDIEDIWLDDNISDINRQTALLWRSNITRPEIWGQARAGNFKNVEKVNEAHRYQYFNEESEEKQTRREDAGKGSDVNGFTELYERWQGWLILPSIKVKLNDKGEATDLTWDQNAAPRRYVLELIGPLNDKNVAVRLSESPYWSNGVPFIAAHSHDDDSGFHRRGLVDLLEDNMVQEQVAKGQMMDCRTLMNFRPMIRVKGRVLTKDLTITANTVFDVTSPDALQQLQIADNTGTLQHTIDYLKDDSEGIGNTPKFMLGEAMGARTTATESSMIRDGGSAPSLNDFKVLNVQIWGAYLRKCAEYYPQFGSNDLVVGELGITPDEFVDLDLDLQEVATTEFGNKQVIQQIMVNLVKSLQSPMFQGVVNPVGVAVKLFEAFPEVFQNPEQLIMKNPMVAAALLEYQTQHAAVQDQQGQPPEGGEAPPPQTEGQMMAGQAGEMGGL